MSKIDVFKLYGNDNGESVLLRQLIWTAQFIHVLQFQ